jgi:hypothetical protein
MAADYEKGEGSKTASQMGSEMALEELLRSLNLKGEDIAGISVAKNEVESLKQDTKWMAALAELPWGKPGPWPTQVLCQTKYSVHTYSYVSKACLIRISSSCMSGSLSGSNPCYRHLD